MLMNVHMCVSSEVLSDLASTRDDMAELESNMEGAIASEDYDEADRLQGEIDTLAV